MKAIVYCRVSTKKQSEDDKFSLDQQEQFGVNFFQSRGISDIEVIRDVFSGDSKLEDRPGGLLLTQLVAAGQVGHLFFKVTDRLFRKAWAALQYVDTLTAKGIQVYIDGVPRDLSRGDDKMMFGFQAIIADRERETIIRRTQEGLRRSRDEGRAYSPNAYGYKRVFDTTGRKPIAKMVIDELEGPIVQRIYELRSQGASYGEIIKALNDSGVPTKFGKNFWYVEAIIQIVKSPIYTGRVKDSTGKLVKSTRYPPIIADGLWDKVQATADQRSYKIYFKRGTNPLTGILRCVHCNAPFNFKEMKYKERIYQSYTHLRVGSRVNDVTKYRKCETTAKYFREHIIEPACAKIWLYGFIYVAFHDVMLNESKERIALAQTEYDILVSRLRRENEVISEKKERIRKAIVDDGLPAAFFSDEVKGLEEQGALLEKQMRIVRDTLDHERSSHSEILFNFSNEKLSAFVENRREVYMKTVRFLCHSKDRTEMRYTFSDALSIYFDPKNISTIEIETRIKGNVQRHTEEIADFRLTSLNQFYNCIFEKNMELRSAIEVSGLISFGNVYGWIVPEIRQGAVERKEKS